MSEHLTELLAQVDAECEEYSLPPLSWVVHDMPGRPNATQDQLNQVYATAARGAYDQLKSLQVFVGTEESKRVTIVSDAVCLICSTKLRL
jgi:hypothetical protein